LVPAGQHASVKTRKNYNRPSNEPTSSGGHKIVNGKTANRPKTLDSALQRIEHLERELASRLPQTNKTANTTASTTAPRLEDLSVKELQRVWTKQLECAIPKWSRSFGTNTTGDAENSLVARTAKTL
jgi:hypothetical protein